MKGFIARLRRLLRFGRAESGEVQAAATVRRRPLRLRFYPRGGERRGAVVEHIRVFERPPESGVKTGQVFTVDVLPPDEPPKRPGVVYPS